MHVPESKHRTKLDAPLTVAALVGLRSVRSVLLICDVVPVSTCVKLDVEDGRTNRKQTRGTIADDKLHDEHH
jgi:hypothetical protein